MELTVLLENTGPETLHCAHGLSLYLETGGKKILFDFGPSGELLLENARKLGVDLAAVDLAVLSHGHYDHAGGLEAFLGVNDRAPVYVHRLAFQPHLARREEGYRDIGADAALPERFPGRFVLTDGVWPVDENLTLFSDISGFALLSGSNAALLEKDGDAVIPDRFLHEQNLLIREGEALALVAGCAHRGIVNILARAEALAGRAPDLVFAGFHLTNPGRHTDEPEALVRAVGEALAERPCRYCTGHCTGQGPYGILEELLGGRLAYLGGGKRFRL